MKTEEIALSRLVENEDNPRQITKENFAKLVKSLLVFPKMLEIRPVVVDEQMKVLGGNMRTRALSEIAKMDAVKMREQIDADGRFTEGEKIAIIDYWNAWKEKPSVRIVRADDLTEAQKREFVIKDNAGFGEWDFNRLANEWDDMPLVDWGVPDWAACQEGEGEERREAQEDGWKGNEIAPERVSGGDLWQLGDHRLMCGDSTSGEHVKFLCAGKQINLLITDPPYNVNYGANSTVKRQAIANDNMEAGQFQDFLTEAFISADDVMAEGGGILHLVCTPVQLAVFQCGERSRVEKLPAADMGEKPLRSWSKRLPVDARAMHLRMEAGSCALFLSRQDTCYRMAG